MFKNRSFHDACESRFKSPLGSDLLGELLGTFLIVFFGCGVVATHVLFPDSVSFLNVAVVWGVVVTLAIYSCRHLSCAHFNPAISFAMFLRGKMSSKRMFVYWSAQFIGAFLAAIVVYIVFENQIACFEKAQGIIRGSQESVRTASIFGEFYLNSPATPGVVSPLAALIAEAIGTFFLTLLIFLLTDDCNTGKPHKTAAPLFIGAAVSIIISVIGPLTQAGLNPARDLSPRVFSFFAGWKYAAFPNGSLVFSAIYVFGPFIGSLIAAFLFSYVVEPMMKVRLKFSE